MQQGVRLIISDCDPADTAGLLSEFAVGFMNWAYALKCTLWEQASSVNRIAVTNSQSDPLAHTQYKHIGRVVVNGYIDGFFGNFVLK